MVNGGKMYPKAISMKLEDELAYERKQAKLKFLVFFLQKEHSYAFQLTSASRLTEHASVNAKSNNCIRYPRYNV